MAPPALTPVTAGWNPSAVAVTAPIVNPLLFVKVRLPAAVRAASVATSLRGCANVIPLAAETPAVSAMRVPAVCEIAPVVVNRKVPVPSVMSCPMVMPPVPPVTPRDWFPPT